MWGSWGLRGCRMVKVMRRNGRVVHIRRVIGWKAQRVVRAGLVPAALFWAGVNGMDDGEVKKVRQLAAIAMRPSGKLR